MFSEIPSPTPQSWRRRRMEVEFVDCFLPCLPSGFLLSSKTNTSNPNSIWNARTHLNEFLKRGLMVKARG